MAGRSAAGMRLSPAANSLRRAATALRVVRTATCRARGVMVGATRGCGTTVFPVNS